MKTQSRILCASVLFTLLLSSSVSCGDAEPTKDMASAGTTQIPASDTQITSALPDHLQVSADLPEDLDFGGAQFRSLVNDTNNNVMVNDIYIESAAGEVVDDAVFDRRIYVEELLNVVIAPSDILPASDASDRIKQSVNAGDDVYDIVLQHMIYAGGDSLEGFFMNWYDIPHMNFTHPWYPQESIESITVDNVMYLLLSDVMLSSLHNTYCFFFNKDIASNFDLPDMYEIVLDGSFTFGKLAELTKGIYQDLNGNGEQDADDQFGYITSIDSNVVPYFWSFDVPLVDVSDGEVNLTANNERAVNTVSMLRDFFYNSGEVYIAEDHLELIDRFKNDKALFIPRCIGETMTYLREMDNYGILPFPKYDEAQENYYTMLDGCSPLIAVPKTTPNTKMVGAVLEAMGEYSYKYVIPAYYEIALKVKGTRDEASMQMLDIINDGRIVDFAFVYDNFNGFSFALPDLLTKNSKRDFASYFESNEKSVRKHYEEVYDLFLNKDNE